MRVSLIIILIITIPMNFVLAADGIDFKKCADFIRDGHSRTLLGWGGIVIGPNGSVGISNDFNQKINRSNGELVIESHLPFPRSKRNQDHPNMIRIKLNKKSQISQITSREIQVRKNGITSRQNVSEVTHITKFGEKGGKCVPMEQVHKKRYLWFRNKAAFPFDTKDAQMTHFNLDLCKEIDDFFKHEDRVQAEKIKKCLACSQKLEQKVSAIFGRYTPLVKERKKVGWVADDDVEKLIENRNPIIAAHRIHQTCKDFGLDKFINDDDLWRNEEPNREKSKGSGILLSR